MARYECTSCGEPARTASESGCTLCGGALIDTSALARARENQFGIPIPNAADAALKGLILTTTPSLEARPVVEYLGPVFGEAILGANLFSDMAASVRDVVGGRSGTYEEKFAHARRIALREMATDARSLGADAVLGVRIDYETLKGSMLMVAAQGTAARLAGDD